MSNSAKYGGSLAALAVDTLILIDSTITGSTAEIKGGAVYLADNLFEISDCATSRENAKNDCKATGVSGSYFELSDCTVEGNIVLPLNIFSCKSYDLNPNINTANYCSDGYCSKSFTAPSDCQMTDTIDMNGITGAFLSIIGSGKTNGDELTVLTAKAGARHIYVGGGNEVYLELLKLIGGSAAGGHGGSITLDKAGSKLIALGCWWMSNTADYGGSLAALAVVTLTLIDSSITGSTAAIKGGAVYVSGEGATFIMSGGRIDGTNDPTNIVDADGTFVSSFGPIHCCDGASVPTCTLDGVLADGGDSYTEDLTTGQTATSSAADDSAGAAIDDDSNTQWSEGSAATGVGAWFQVTFDSAKHIRRISLQTGSGNNVATGQKLQYSADGSTWVTAQEYTVVANANKQIFAIAASGSYTRWRLLSTTAVSNPYSWAINQLEMFEADGAPCQAGQYISGEELVCTNWATCAFGFDQITPGTTSTNKQCVVPMCNNVDGQNKDFESSLCPVGKTLKSNLAVACAANVCVETDCCFTLLSLNNAAELKSAVDSCLSETSDGSCPIFSGESNGMGAWDVSRVTNMNSLFKNAGIPVEWIRVTDFVSNDVNSGILEKCNFNYNCVAGYCEKRINEHVVNGRTVDDGGSGGTGYPGAINVVKEVCDADTSCVAIDHRSDENTGHKCDTVSNYGTCCTYQICTKNVASKSNCETLSTAGFFNAE